MYKRCKKWFHCSSSKHLTAITFTFSEALLYVSSIHKMRLRQWQFIRYSWWAQPESSAKTQYERKNKNINSIFPSLYFIYSSPWLIFITVLESDYYFLFQLEKRDFEYECITRWGIYTGFKTGNFKKWENDKN